MVSATPEKAPGQALACAFISVLFGSGFAGLGKGKILIPNALDIERLINKTQKGELLTNDIIRETLAKEKKYR
ncbi:hypothetical protein IID10_01625 [candidate division KSB1 bacterium]|nr:hypothetical protein [candidate division KSB1 bacterium]